LKTENNNFVKDTAFAFPKDVFLQKETMQCRQKKIQKILAFSMEQILKGF
jgi:hypothetical protein